MAKTKLLFDIEKLLTASPEEKGICRVALEVLKRISKNKNYLVFPIVTIKKGVSPEKYLKEKGLEYLIPNIVKMPYLKKTTHRYNIYKNFYCWALAKKYRKKYLPLLNQYDEYFSVFSPISPLVYESNVKTKLMIHDMIPLTLPAVFNPHFVKKFRSWIKQANADEIICDSKFTLNDFLKFRPDYKNKKTKVVYLAASSDFQPTESDSIRKTYHIPTSKYFLAVSNHSPRKNIGYILDSFFEFLDKTNAHDVSLVLAGSQINNIPDISRKLQMHSRHTDKIVCTGYVPDKDMPALYSGAEAYLYPSIYEGFGLPIVEAMKCGTPVITCSNSSLPEVGGNAALYVSETNTEELVKVMTDLYIHPQRRKKLSQRCLQQAQHFSWDTTVAQIFNLK